MRDREKIGANVYHSEKDPGLENGLTAYLGYSRYY